MGLLFKKAGIFTSVQDLGRFGYQRFGINPTGAMDTVAARLANLLVANDPNDAVIEMHFPAAEIVFTENTIAAITGADLEATLDNKPLSNWSTCLAKPGNILRFLGKTLGNRSYLAVAGGLAIDRWLGSSSTNLAAEIGGFKGRRIQSGDELTTNSPNIDKRLLGRHVSPSLVPLYRPFPTARVIRGAEFERLDRGSAKLFESQDYAISAKSDRMGFRLAAEPLELNEKVELLSSGVSRGTIQLLPDGQLIVLMADHQTTGGYPRIAHVVSRDLPLMGQLGSGDKVAFHFVDISHAEQLANEFEREMTFFRVAALGKTGT